MADCKTAEENFRTLQMLPEQLCHRDVTVLADGAERFTMFWKILYISLLHYIYIYIYIYIRVVFLFMEKFFFLNLKSHNLLFGEV